jgi:Domain of unknown function (DUF2382)
MLPGTALLSAIGSSPGAEIGEDEQEIILHEERPVISKETVPVERVRIRAERREEDQTVRSEVRKERIEVERGDDDTSRRTVTIAHAFWECPEPALTGGGDQHMVVLCAWCAVTCAVCEAAR